MLALGSALGWLHASVSGSHSHPDAATAPFAAQRLPCGTAFITAASLCFVTVHGSPGAALHKCCQKRRGRGMLQPRGFPCTQWSWGILKFPSLLNCYRAGECVGLRLSSCHFAPPSKTETQSHSTNCQVSRSRKCQCSEVQLRLETGLLFQSFASSRFSPALRDCILETWDTSFNTCRLCPAS